MRLSYRLILSLIAGVTRLKDDVQRRALLLAESEQTPVEAVVQNGYIQNLQALVDRFRNHEQLAGVAVFDAQGQPLAMTQAWPRVFLLRLTSLPCH